MAGPKTVNLATCALVIDDMSTHSRQCIRQLPAGQPAIVFPGLERLISTYSVEKPRNRCDLSESDPVTR
jgi:hypothetical protein